MFDANKVSYHTLLPAVWLQNHFNPFKVMDGQVVGRFVDIAHFVFLVV